MSSGTLQSITLAVLLAFVVSSCAKKHEELTELPLPAGITYNVLEEKINTSLKKSNIRIELSDRIAEADLRTLALAIKEQRQGLERLWIYYTVKKDSQFGLLWATTHFTPELEIQIHGTTIEQAKLSSGLNVPDAEVIGRWHDPAGPGQKLMIYRRAGKYFLRTVLPSQDFYESELRLRKERGKQRFDYVEDMHGEYFVISTDGELGCFNASNEMFGEGDIYTLEAVDPSRKRR